MSHVNNLICLGILMLFFPILSKLMVKIKKGQRIIELLVILDVIAGLVEAIRIAIS